MEPLKTISDRQGHILGLIRLEGRTTSSVISSAFADVTLLTIKRDLSDLVKKGYLAVEGRGRATSYVTTATNRLFVPVDAHAYCATEQDKRKGYGSFDTSLIAALPYTIFSVEERRDMDSATRAYFDRAIGLTSVLQKKELERFVIDLSWKSSRIEGNTYTFLDTERLLKEGVPGKDNTPDETHMILNHKAAFDFVLAERARFAGVPEVAAIEELHRLLVADLGVERGLRKSMVRIGGTNYRPLDNPFQLQEALRDLLEHVGATTDPYTAALYALAGLSYIQFFEDGNKRTARLTANAVLLSRHAAPLSYRSVDEIVYREATLVFYETHSLMPLKELFMAQYLFAAEQYGII